MILFKTFLLWIGRVQGLWKHFDLFWRYWTLMLWGNSFYVSIKQNDSVLLEIPDFVILWLLIFHFKFPICSKFKFRKKRSLVFQKHRFQFRVLPHIVKCFWKNSTIPAPKTNHQSHTWQTTIIVCYVTEWALQDFFYVTFDFDSWATCKITRVQRSHCL